MARRGFRRYLRSFFDIPRWMGVDHLRRTASSMRDLASSLFKIKLPEHEETFEQAIERLGLKPEDIANRQQSFLRLAQAYLACFVAALCYGIYLLVNGHYQAAILTSGLCLMLFAFFFREHFWYTQMKHRRLGFTFWEWVQSLWTTGERP